MEYADDSNALDLTRFLEDPLKKIFFLLFTRKTTNRDSNLKKILKTKLFTGWIEKSENCYSKKVKQTFLIVLKEGK